jgi:hypothetical protein
MANSSNHSVLNEIGLHRTRLRLRGRKAKLTKLEPRKAAAILSMVDLLSCAFGGAIFLFLLTAAPPAAREASPKTTTEDGYVAIWVNSTMVRPIFVLKQRKTGISFVVDGTTLVGQSAHRKVAGSRSGDTGGHVYAIGATPWDAEPGGQLQSLLLKFDKPVAEWCLRYGTASDDSSARARSVSEIKEAPIQIRVQGPRARGFLEVKLPNQAVPQALQMSPCQDFDLL